MTARRFVAGGFDAAAVAAGRGGGAPAAAGATCPWPARWGDDADPADAPTFTEAELVAAVADARREGYAEAEARVTAAMAASQAERQAEALASIGAQLAVCQAAYERTLAARATASRELAFALAETLAAEALARLPLADVEAMVRGLVGRLEEAPRLELHLPPPRVEDGTALLTEVAAQAGYRGQLVVEGDPALDPGDARLRWQDGAAERDQARLAREAAAVVDAWLPPAEAAPAPPEADGIVEADDRAA